MEHAQKHTQELSKLQKEPQNKTEHGHLLELKYRLPNLTKIYEEHPKYLKDDILLQNITDAEPPEIVKRIQGAKNPEKILQKFKETIDIRDEVDAFIASSFAQELIQEYTKDPLIQDMIIKEIKIPLRLFF